MWKPSSVIFVDAQSAPACVLCWEWKCHDRGSIIHFVLESVWEEQSEKEKWFLEQIIPSPLWQCCGQTRWTFAFLKATGSRQRNFFHLQNNVNSKVKYEYGYVGENICSCHRKDSVRSLVSLFVLFVCFSIFDFLFFFKDKIRARFWNEGQRTRSENEELELTTICFLLSLVKLKPLVFLQLLNPFNSLWQSSA